jgi:hypothetical protein
MTSSSPKAPPPYRGLNFNIQTIISTSIQPLTESFIYASFTHQIRSLQWLLITPFSFLYFNFTEITYFIIQITCATRAGWGFGAADTRGQEEGGSSHVATEHMKLFRHTLHSPQLSPLQGKAETSNILFQLTLPQNDTPLECSCAFHEPLLPVSSVSPTLPT